MPCLIPLSIEQRAEIAANIQKSLSRDRSTKNRASMRVVAGENAISPDQIKALLKPGAVVREMEGVRQRLKQNDKRHRAALFSEMVMLRKLHTILLANRDAWLELCRRPEWVDRSPRMRPKPDNPEAAALFLADFVADGDRKRRSRWRSALEELHARRVPPSLVIETLRKSKGVRGLADAWAQRAERKRLEEGFKPPAKQPKGKVGKLSRPSKPASTSKKGRDSVAPENNYENFLLHKNSFVKHLLSGDIGLKSKCRLEIVDKFRGVFVIKLSKPRKLLPL